MSWKSSPPPGPRCPICGEPIPGRVPVALVQGEVVHQRCQHQEIVRRAIELRARAAQVAARAVEAVAVASAAHHAPHDIPTLGRAGADRPEAAHARRRRALVAVVRRDAEHVFEILRTLFKDEPVAVIWDRRWRDRRGPASEGWDRLGFRIVSRDQIRRSRS